MQVIALRLVSRVTVSLRVLPLHRAHNGHAG